MLQLPNRCRAGKMSVFPSNWKTVRANASITWYISYRFYDDNLGKSKKVVIKGMNQFSTAIEKREATQALIDDEVNLILHQGYNRITKTYSTRNSEEVTEDSPFNIALDYAYSKVHAEESTMTDLKSCLNYLKQAATKLMYANTPVKDIKRKHLIQLLDTCGEIKVNTIIPIGKKGKTKKGIWTANTYNQYRSNLSMLYKRLLKFELVEANYVENIDKRKSTKKIRETLTPDQRKTVNQLLYHKSYQFWRFLHIFFHSGSRETEMLRLRHDDIDMAGQRFKVLVKKGGAYREEWRVIKNVILPLWEEVYNESEKGQYLFSEGLAPMLRDKPIRREQITRRWKVHVKNPLAITADFYSLKHTNLDETAELLSIHDASKMAGHTSTVITMKHYAVGEKKRQDEKLKGVGNSFA